MRYPSLNDAKHWRDRATEMRTLAEDMTDVESRSIMFRLASDYERLASRAEERAKTLTRGPSPIPEQSRDGTRCVENPPGGRINTDRPILLRFGSTRPRAASCFELCGRAFRGGSP